ncbi:major facilitator superfamily domain-containing protein [Xylariales sp. PMI_506]|nr:major facilitator superfamily domain-containing protein [Xylariales sp. PMI_506]
MAIEEIAEKGNVSSVLGNEADARHSESQIHEFKESEGYEVNVESATVGTVKLAPDGRTRLIPQPSDDPNDPLNWSSKKKHLILYIIALTALLPDYGSATGAVVLEIQAAEWGMTADEVNHSQVGNVFMLGAGGIFVVALSAYFCRLPVMFYWILLALATAIWCAAATTFDSFMAARILNGFFATVAQVGGLMFIQDMFFFHERARKINVWASFFVVSPYVGPLFAAFMVAAKPWPTPFWVYSAETALCLILITLFVDETFYDRRIPASEQPPRGSRVSRLLGIAQFRSRHLRNSFGQAWIRPLRALTKPTVLISTLYYLLTFAWVVGINTTLSLFLTPVYGFGPDQIGYFYFTPIVAVILGELTGHFLHDVIAKQYIRSHNGHFEPEVRLRAIFISLPFMVVGLVLLGQSLGREWHYMAAAISWGLYVFGIMITTVAISSYNLDCYPEASGEVSAWVNNSRTLGGFIVSYFQVTWATVEGTQLSFGIQAAICAAAFLLILLLLWKGKAMRIWAGPLHFATT